MTNPIQIRRGNKTDLPILLSGEWGFVEDLEEIYIGTGSSNIRILTSDDLYSHPSGIQCTPSLLTAGTGLSGDTYNGTTGRTWSVSYGATANTACEGNDSRLTNSREWTASTVSQADAEAGTGTVRTAWTAERVKQAIAALGGKDNVLPYASTANFPATGASGIIYIAENTNLMYRWNTVTEDYTLLGEIPTTPAPTFTVASVSMNEMAESSLTIQNYDADNTYTVESLDTDKATVARSGSSFVITTKHVSSNTSCSVRIKATAPEYLTSDWTTITVNISTITFYADDAIQVVDFTDEALYSTNWSLV